MTGETVLVIEDSLVVRAALRRHLEGDGFSVVDADDGVSGLTIASEVAPDVVLVDIELPGIDGFAVLERLKADEDLRDVPVVFLTGRTDHAEMIRALDRGAHDYLRKPFEEGELVARVRAAVRAKVLNDELRRRAEALARAASIDALTGLANRRHLDERLRAELSLARRHGRAVGVIVMDVDRFKLINDTAGHAGGDAVLQELARRLAAAVRIEDEVGRWGGEEFLVVVPDATAAGVMALAERLRRAVSAQVITIDGGNLEVTVSVGCTLGRDEQPEAVVNRADAAMYEAKQGGRDAVVCACAAVPTRPGP